MSTQKWRGHTMYQCDTCAFSTLQKDVYDAHLLDHAEPPENPIDQERRKAEAATKADRSKKSATATKADRSKKSATAKATNAAKAHTTEVSDGTSQSRSTSSRVAEPDSGDRPDADGSGHGQ